MKTESEIKKEIVEICRRMYSKGFIAALDGNVSVKLSPNRILVTPSGVNKGYIYEESIVVVDQEGRKIKGKLAPTSELAMHLCAYSQRPDISAVIHAHPPICIAFSIANYPIAKCLLPEVIVNLREIPVTKYATPTTKEVPEAIKEMIKSFDALILDRHGSLTVGEDLESAYNRLEMIEHAAKITLAAKQLGNVTPLPKEEVDRLIKMGSSISLKRAYSECQGCGACNSTRGVKGEKKESQSLYNHINKEELVKIILEEIEKSTLK